MTGIAFAILAMFFTVVFFHTQYGISYVVCNFTSHQYRVVGETSPVAEVEHPAVFKVGEALWRARALPPVRQLDYIGLYQIISDYIGSYRIILDYIGSYRIISDYI